MTLAAPATYRWQLLRAGPLRLDGGGMFGVIPRAIWNKSIPVDEQGRIGLAHNCLLLSPSPRYAGERAGERGQVHPTSRAVRSADSRMTASPATSDVSRNQPLSPALSPAYQGEGECVLIETGSGDKFDEKQRRIYGLSDRCIVDALHEVDIHSSDVADVVVTHLHFDHAGGLTRRGRNGDVVRTFSNATVHVQRREWDDALANRSTMTRTYLRDNLDPIHEQLNLIDSPQPFAPAYLPDRNESPSMSLSDRATSILPGIDVFVVPGHTWGQQAVRFTDDRGRVVVFAPDVIPTAAHVGATYNMAYDVEPYMSTINRRWFLQEASENDWVLVLPHEPGDPRRRARSDGKGWFELVPAAE